MKPLITLESVDVALDGKVVLRGLNWQLNPGENWAIVGGNGSGKSTFLKLIRGELWPRPDGRSKRIYAFDDGEQTTAVGIRERIALVSPELQARYLQQDWRLTGLETIFTGFFGTDLLYQNPGAQRKKFAHSIVQMLGVAHLLKRHVQQLSTGELRKILIARALVASPAVLVCDEICDGLDANSRGLLLQTLEQIACAGTPLLYTTHRPEELIPSLTHILRLADGRIAQQGRIGPGRVPHNGARLGAKQQTILPMNRSWERRRLAGAFHQLAATRRRDAGAPRKSSGSQGAIMKSGSAAVSSSTSRSTAQGAATGSATTASLHRSLPNPKSAGVLIQIRRANVFLGRKKILRDINWEMRVREHWGVLGPNGAGKTTLLKLIASEVYPAVGAEVRRFDLTAQNTIWDLGLRLGSVSPTLQAGYREALTGREVVLSGFFSSVGLIEKVNAWQRRRVRDLFQSFGLSRLAGQSTLSMSYGEFRAILLLRALVNHPRILILDEPFDGLDSAARASMAAALQRVARQGTSLIVVTHHSSDLPPCVTHLIRMADGRIVEQGPVAPSWQPVKKT